ncbi:MAG: DUF58 domain-containing protein [Halobacteriaceae archaeon]
MTERHRVDAGLLGVAILAAGIGLVGLVNRAFGARLVGGVSLLNGLGLAAVVLAARAAWRRLLTGRSETRLPETGRRRGATLAGGSLDRALQRREQSVRDRLRETAEQVLEGETDGDVSASLADGSWTEDAAAAAFFTDEETRPGLLGRARERLRDTPTPVRRAQAVVDALGALYGAEWSAESPGQPARSGDEAFDRLDPDESIVRSTGRFDGVEAVPLVAVGIGILFRSPGALLIGAVTALLTGLVMASEPPPAALAIDHRIETERPRPGDAVRITVAITNESERRIADLRLADGVPPALRTVRGQPTLAGTIEPGETITTTYEVQATFGRHELEPAYVLVRDGAGATERLLRPAGGAALACLPSLVEPATPAPPRTTPWAGQVDTRSGGAGVEFFGTRSYQRGDSLTQVDWKRLARTGELTTIEFREERAASVVLVLDTRASAYVAPTWSDEHAVSRGVSAATTLAAGLLDEGDRVGLATLGPNQCWVPPGAGTDHRARLRTRLGTDTAFSATPSSDRIDAAAVLARLRARLSAGTAVVLLSPLIDDWPTSVVQRLRADGVPVTVLSPDPTGGATAGTRLARIERARRLSELRRRGIPTIDWGRDDPLGVVLARHARR